MTSFKRSLINVGVTLSFLASGFVMRPAHACSTTTAMTYFGGYVDAYDQPANVFYVFWGYGTYGDGVSFESAARSEFNSDSPLASFGIGATRFYGVPSQYAGIDWNTNVNKQIAPTPGATWIEDEGGLPAPDPVTGQINLTDDDVGNEADFIGNYFGLSYDDIVVIFLPQNAPPPVSSACGQHFVAPQDTITAWIAYPGQGFGCTFDFQEQAIQHEITEAVVNPAWNRGSSFEGWDQGAGAFCEISDICQGLHFSISNQPFGVMQTQPEFSNEAVAAGKNGCIYGRSTTAYVAGLSGGTLHTTTVAANTSVSIASQFSWGAPTGVTLTGAPAVASWGKDHVDAFARGTNGKIYHATSDDGGSTRTWELLNSATSFTQAPDAATWGSGNIQVFGVQGNNIVRNVKTYGGSWSGWTSVNKPAGVNPVSKVSVVSWGAWNMNTGTFPTSIQTVLAAFRGSNGKVYVGNSFSGGSFTWSSFNAPATLTGDVDISAWAPPRFDLFVLDTSGNIWDMLSTNGTTVSSSVNFGHPSAGGFQVSGGGSGMGDGRLLLGGRLSSNASYVQLWNWAPGTWASLGFNYTSPIDIASP